MECGSGWNSANTGNDSGGRVFVEILHCDTLPSCDVKNKTNAFVSIVHEDAAVTTDVISSCLSPLWMPWTKRAFAFNRMNSLSAMYVGVFHHDPVNPTGHTGLGRVTINLQQMRPDHVYLLSYTLYTSSVYTNRVPSGTITLRVRLDGGKFERSLLLETIKPSLVQLNFKKKKSLSIVKYTVWGDHQEDKFDLNLLKSEANEMMELLQSIQYAISESLVSLVFWRGQVGGGGASGGQQAKKFPLYSLVVYLFLSYVVERPHLLPSLFFWVVFFVMFASYGHRTHHPSPWHQCRHILDFVSILVKGSSFPMSTRVKAGMGAKETLKLEQARQARIEIDDIVYNKRVEMEAQVTEVEEVAANETKKSSGSKVVPQIDPLAMLIPLQQKIEQVIYYPRFVKSVVTWVSSTISFFVTAGSFAVALTLSILPTAWLIQWICRIVIHVGLGPHMKVVDAVFFNSYTDLEDDGDRIKEEKNMMKKLTNEFRGRNKTARVKAERELKLWEMRKIRMGPNSITLPPLNVTRFADYPLPASTVTPASLPGSDKVKGWNDRVVVPGQKLYGELIPSLKKQTSELPNEDDLDQTNGTDVSTEADLDCSDNNLMDTNESEEHERQLQLLADYNFQLAQAKADLDLTTLKSRQVKQGDDIMMKRLQDTEKEVERLQNVVEEMTHMSFPGGQLVETDLNHSCKDEEITLDENLVSGEASSSKDEKLSLPLKGNNDLGQTVEERDAITSPQSSGSNNSRFGVQDDDLTNANEPPSSLIMQDHTDAESAKLQEDEDTYDDDPFSTFDEETRSCSRTAKSTPKPERSLHGLFQNCI